MGKKRIAQKSGDQTSISTLPREGSVGVAAAPKGIKDGRITIYSSYNNTIISLCDTKGNVLAALSAGRIGFKGTKKSTPYAASKVAEAIAQLAEAKGIAKVEVFIKGVGAGRDSALRSLGAKNLEITGIRDVTPIPHNGPRPQKVRRV